MPVFTVVCIDDSGIKTEKLLSAGTKIEAMNLASDDYHTAVSARIDWKSVFQGKLKNSEMSEILQYIAELLDGGMDTYTALELAVENARNKKSKKILSRMLASREKGMALAECFEETAAFPPEVAPIVSAGEESGQLVKRLKLLAEDFETRSEGSKSLIANLIHPIFVLIVVTGITLFILTSALPEMVRHMSEDKIPTITKFAVAIGIGIKNYWFLYLIGFIGIIIGLYFFYISNKKAIIIMLSRIPVFRSFIKGRIYAPFFSSLAILLESGVATSKAISVVGKQNAFLQEQCRDILARIDEGESLDAALMHDPILGNEARTYIQRGSQTGLVASASEKLGKLYATNLKIVIQRMISISNPVVFLLAGGVLLFLVLSFYLPTYQAFQNYG
jgi:type II secretory pathway component PulF